MTRRTIPPRGLGLERANAQVKKLTERVPVHRAERLRDAVAGTQALGLAMTLKGAVTLGLVLAARHLERRYNGGEPFQQRKDALPVGRFRTLHVLTPRIRVQIMERVRAGHTHAAIATELGLPSSLLSDWVRCRSDRYKTSERWALVEEYEQARATMPSRGRRKGPR